MTGGRDSAGQGLLKCVSLSTIASGDLDESAPQKV